MSEPTRVLFVCLGNICRSPLAEGVMLQRLAQRGVQGVTVESCGTGGWHVGESADPRTLAVLAKHGAPEPSLARQLDRLDFERFDLLLAMDRSNLQNLQRQCPREYAHKLHLMLELTGGGEVPDPYYGGDSGFDDVYKLVSDAVDAWLLRLLQEHLPTSHAAPARSPAHD